MDNAHVLM